MFVSIDEENQLTEFEAAQLAPLTLAYIGDSVFDLFVRTKMALSCSKNAGALHKMSIKLVNARAQAELAKGLMESFTESESEIFRRGRNAKSATVPKNMSMIDYKYATAMEAVIGYLYVTGQTQRIKVFLSQMNFEV